LDVPGMGKGAKGLLGAYLKREKCPDPGSIRPKERTQI